MDAARATDGLHMSLYLLLPPLSGLALSWWIWRRQRLASE